MNRKEIKQKFIEKKKLEFLGKISEEAIDETIKLYKKEQNKKIKELKEEWQKKMKRMEVISIDVSIFELNNLVDNVFAR